MGNIVKTNIVIEVTNELGLLEKLETLQQRFAFFNLFHRQKIYIFFFARIICWYLLVCIACYDCLLNGNLITLEQKKILQVYNTYIEGHALYEFCHTARIC